MPDRVPAPTEPPPPPGWPGPVPASPPAPGSLPPLGLAAVGLAVFLGAQLLVGAVGGLLLAVTAAVGSDAVPGPTALVALAVGGQAVGLLAVLALLRHRRVPLAPLLGRRRPAGPLLAVGVGIGAATLLASSAVVAGLTQLAGSTAEPDQILLREVLAGGRRAALAVLAAVVLAPLAEELLFRGLLYRALRRHRSVATAATISAILFAVVHAEVVVSQPLALPGLVVVGVVLAVALERSRSLLVPIAAHATFNGLTLLAALAYGRLGPIGLGSG